MFSKRNNNLVNNIVFAKINKRHINRKKLS